MEFLGLIEMANFYKSIQFIVKGIDGKF